VDQGRTQLVRMERGEVGYGRPVAGQVVVRGARDRVDVEGADRTEAGALEAERAAASASEQVQYGIGLAHATCLHVFQRTMACTVDG